MPKLKTHKGIKKVLKVRPNGTVTMGKPGSRHNTGSKSAKFNRSCRSGSKLAKGDYNRLKNVL